MFQIIAFFNLTVEVATDGVNLHRRSRSFLANGVKTFYYHFFSIYLPVADSTSNPH